MLGEVAVLVAVLPVVVVVVVEVVVVLALVLVALGLGGRAVRGLKSRERGTSEMAGQSQRDGRGQTAVTVMVFVTVLKGRGDGGENAVS